MFYGNYQLFLALLLYLPLFAQIDKEGDFQFWQRNEATFELNSKWNLHLQSKLQWGDDASRLYYFHTASFMVYQPVRWVELAPGYRQIYRQAPLNSKRWKWEYYPFVDLFLILKVKKWTIQDRNRIAYRWLQNDPFHWIYRNKIRLIAPSISKQFCVQPFLENELLFSEGCGLDQDRVSGGVLLRFNKSVAGDFFYTARFLKQAPHWVYQNVLNFAVSFYF